MPVFPKILKTETSSFESMEMIIFLSLALIDVFVLLISEGQGKWVRYAFILLHTFCQHSSLLRLLIS